MGWFRGAPRRRPTGRSESGLLAALPPQLRAAWRAWRLWRFARPVVLFLSSVAALALVSAVVSVSLSPEGGIPYTGESLPPEDRIPEEYLEAYMAAAAEYDVPWTVLAAVGKVASDHGRSAPSDLEDYGQRIDRASGWLGSGRYSSPAPGVSKSSPPPGTPVVFVDPIAEPPPLPEYRTSVASSGSDPEAMTSVVEGAAAQDGVAVVTLPPSGGSEWSKALAEAIGSSGWVCLVFAVPPDPVSGAFDPEWVREVFSVVDQAPPGAEAVLSNRAGWATVVADAVSGCVESGQPEELAGEAAAGPPPDAPGLPPPGAWTRYGCAPTGGCGPVPAMGVGRASPKGPFQFDPEWFEENGSGRDPNDVRDAAELLASTLASLAEEVRAADPGLYGRGLWASDAETARALWSSVLRRAPVVLPEPALPGPECPVLPGLGSLVWPAPGDPEAVSGYSDESPWLGVASKAATAAASGQVVAVTADRVEVSHLSGLVTVYSGVRPVVEVGDTVDPGDPVGEAPGGVFRFQVAAGGSPRDPVLFLESPPPPAAPDPQAGQPAAQDPQAGIPADRCSPAVRMPEPGSLLIPVAGVGPEDLTDTWQAPRPGGRRHQGIDIFSPEGTPVMAASPGTVEAVDTGLGCQDPSWPPNVSVGVRGDDGNYYWYAHLATRLVSPGERVLPGQQIGTVGATGNACGTPPHLHFSINEGTPRATDPYPLLVSGMSASYMWAYSPVEQVLAYASYYGGLVPGDPSAGVFDLAASRGPGSFGSATSDGRTLDASQQQMAAIIARYFPPEEVDNAVRVARCESGLDPYAVNVNDDGSRDLGLFQINTVNMPWLLRRTGEDPYDFSRAFDPDWNVRAARVLFDDRWWQPWVCAAPATETRPYGLGIVAGLYSSVPGPGDTSGRFGG